MLGSLQVPEAHWSRRHEKKTPNSTSASVSCDIYTRRLDQFHSSTESSNIYVIQLSVSAQALEIFVRYLSLQSNPPALIILQDTMTIARCLLLFPLSSCRLPTIDGISKSITNQLVDPFETRLFARTFRAWCLFRTDFDGLYLALIRSERDASPSSLHSKTSKPYGLLVHSAGIYYPIGIYQILPIESLQSLSGYLPTNFCFLLFILTIRLCHIGPQSPFISILSLDSPSCRLHHSHRRLVSCDLIWIFNLLRYPSIPFPESSFSAPFDLGTSNQLASAWPVRQSIVRIHPIVATAEWRKGIRK